MCRELTSDQNFVSERSVSLQTLSLRLFSGGTSQRIVDRHTEPDALLHRFYSDDDSCDWVGNSHDRRSSVIGINRPNTVVRHEFAGQFVGLFDWQNERCAGNLFASLVDDVRIDSNRNDRFAGST